MCGIAGFAGPGGRAELAAMTSALAHRGPDGEGMHADEAQGVFLGHRRLAIIDIEGGAQPLWNEDGTVCVVFNGEIYNHAELRRELLACGHIFKSDHSDTEVLVHGYEQWGRELPARLNGMFAFAVYDSRRGRLFLARDRFGEKPLYYFERNGLFAFASELTALRKHPGAVTPVNRLALQKYFAHGFIPAPNALYESSFKLPGGWWLERDTRQGRTERGCYWTFELRPDEALSKRREDDLADELRALFQQAVARRLISDVPLGVFLSGGIDSGATLAAASAAGNAKVKTFTIGFTEPSFDESGFARELAAHFGAAHHEQVLDLDLARELLPDILRRMDEPLADASLLPTYLLARFTRQHVTVALSGDGGDELFAGYDPFKALAPARFYSAIVPRFAHRSLRWLVERLPVSNRNMSLDFKLRRTLQGLSYPQSLWNPVWLGPLDPAALSDVFDAPFALEEVFSEALTAWNRAPGLSLVDRTLEFYTRFYLQDGILMKVDRAAMMNLLESRAVFLDNDLTDFCMRLPSQFKYRDGERKYLLKRALEPMLPAATLNRRKKGFGIPASRWLKHMPVETRHSGALLNAPEVRQRWEAHRAGRADHRLFLWAAMALEGHLAGAQGTVFQ
jgi:asparagine synthase (glutamine-hydrolysing)